MSLLELNSFIEQKRKEALHKNRAETIYMYNSDLTVLYYTACSQTALRSVLGIIHESIRNFIKTGSAYLGF
jgi:hypothetical protein